MMLISWKITLVAMCGMIPIFIFTKFMVAYYMKISKEIQEEKAKLGNVIQDSIGNIRTVKAFSNERREAEKFAEQNAKKYELGKKMAKLSAGWEFTQQFFMNTTFAGLLYYSSILIEAKEMTIGDIMSILLYMI